MADDEADVAAKTRRTTDARRRTAEARRALNESLEELDRTSYQHRLLSIGASMATTLGVSVAIAGLFSQTLDRRGSEPIVPAVTQQQLLDQQRRIDRMQAAVQEALKAPPHGADAQPRSAEVVALNRRLDAIETEQRRLSAIITASPEKAVAIPMMRRDIDDVKTSQTQAGDALRREIDKIYDLNKWIIGGLAVGVLGLLVRDLFRTRGQLG